MARPQSDGLLYFPMDVHFFSDQKIRILRTKFGDKGFSVYMYLLCLIYSNGYYTEYTDDLIAVAGADLGHKENFIREVVDFLAGRSMFDDTLLRSDKVLTSRDIQLQYQASCKMRGSKRLIEVEKRYWVLKPNETLTFVKLCPDENYSEKNVSYSKKNSNSSVKNAVKDIKGYKRKEKDRKVYERRRRLPGESCRYRIMSSSEKILLLYRKLCPSLAPVAMVGAKARGCIRDGIKGGYTIDDYRKLFSEVDKSKFLRGEAKNNTFKATFGWLVDPEHMAEVIKGERRDFDYKEDEPKKDENKSFDVDDFFEAAVRRSYSEDF